MWRYFIFFKPFLNKSDPKSFSGAPETTTISAILPVAPGCEDPASRPNIVHESDCKKFYHCGADGSKVLKECGPGTLFSQASFTCKWPAEVKAERPECGGGPVYTSAATSSPATTTASSPVTSFGYPATTTTEEEVETTVPSTTTPVVIVPAVTTTKSVVYCNVQK